MVTWQAHNPVHIPLHGMEWLRRGYMGGNMVHTRGSITGLVRAEGRNGIRSSREHTVSPMTYGPDMPVPVKHLRTSALLDTGIALRTSQEAASTNREESNIIEFDHLVGRRMENCVHLDKPLLVRIRLLRQAGEVVRVLAESREMRSGGLRIALPCTLGLRSGSIVDMELFLESGEDPLAVRGRVNRAVSSNSEDVEKHCLDIDFDTPSSTALNRIDSFLQKSEPRDCRQLPA